MQKPLHYTTVFTKAPGERIELPSRLSPHWLTASCITVMLPRNQSVDRMGIEPITGCLQGILAPLVHVGPSLTVPHKGLEPLMSFDASLRERGCATTACGAFRAASGNRTQIVLFTRQVHNHSAKAAITYRGPCGNRTHLMLLNRQPQCPDMPKGQLLNRPV